MDPLTKRVLRSERFTNGLNAGCHLAAILFCNRLQPFLQRAVQDAKVVSATIMDDVNLAGRLHDTIAAGRRFVGVLPDEYEINSKSFAYGRMPPSPTGSQGVVRWVFN